MATSTKAKLRRNPNKDGLFGIVVQVIHNRKPTEFSVNQYVAQKDFDPIKGLVKSKHPRATKLNKDISDLKRKIEDIIFDLNQSGKPFKVSDIKKILDGKKIANIKQITFSKYLEDYIKLNPDDLGVNTLSYYKTTLARWNEKFSHILLTEVTETIIVNFRNHLVKEFQNSTNTIYNRMKTIRKMLHRARKNGLIQENSFANVTLKQEKGKREHLTEGEIKAIEQLELEHPSKILTRDVFLFSVYTGLRFSDICTLKKNDITELTGGKYRLKIKMQKTKEPLEFTLSTKASEIALRYKFRTSDSEYIFPMLDKSRTNLDTEIKKMISSANAHQNVLLKEIVSEAGIQNKSISIHCGRHSNAVISIEKGADLYVLSKMLGHNSISTTEIYARMSDKRKDELTELWNE